MEATIYLTKEHLSENKNRFNVDPDDLAHLLKTERFTIDSSSEYIRYQSMDYPNLTGKFPKFVSTLSATHVKTAYEAMDEADKLRIASDQIKSEPIKLPDLVAVDIEATFQGKHATFSYKAFPEFQKELKQTDLSDVTLMRSVRIVQRDFQTTFDKLQQVQRDFGVEIIRTAEEIIFRQPALGIEEKCNPLVSDEFVGQVGMALGKIERAAIDYREGCELKIYLLEDRGYEVSEKDGAFVVKDPRKADLDAIEIPINFVSLSAKDTIKIIGRLENRYPVQKKGVTACYSRHVSNRGTY